MELNEKIRQLRLSKSLTQKELSQMINVSETSIKCWESGSKSPSVQRIIALCKALDVSTDCLLGFSNSDSEQNGVYNLLYTPSEKILLKNYRALDKHGKDMVEAVCRMELQRIRDDSSRRELEFFYRSSRGVRTIPKYLTPIAAGFSAPIDEDNFELIEIDSHVPPEANFAVTISGNSMFPYIEDGDVVYVHRTNVIEVGDVGVFCVDGAMYCKQYYKDAYGNLTLVSANPELKDSNIELSFESNSSIVCYGKVLLGKRIPFPKYFTSQR